MTDNLQAVRMNQPPTGEAVAWMTPGGDVSRSWLWCNERCLAGQNPTPLYTAPPADAPGAVRALVQRWVVESNWRSGGVRATYKRCADELRAMLAAAPKPEES